MNGTIKSIYVSRYRNESIAYYTSGATRKLKNNGAHKTKHPLTDARNHVPFIHTIDFTASQKAFIKDAIAIDYDTAVEYITRDEYEARRADLRQTVIDWQCDRAHGRTDAQSITDEYSNFEYQAELYGLLEEFRENGIL